MWFAALEAPEADSEFRGCPNAAFASDIVARKAKRSAPPLELGKAKCSLDGQGADRRGVTAKRAMGSSLKPLQFPSKLWGRE